MLINVHAHVLTKGMFDHDPHWGPTWVNNTLKVGNWTLGDSVKTRPPVWELFSIETTRARMEERGIDTLVISQPAHMFMYWAGEFGTRFATIVNDELAAYCTQEPGRVRFWALTPMGDPDVAPKELQRAVADLGAVGMIMGGANFGGREADDPAFYPLWEKVIELNVPIFVHGYNQSAALDLHEDPYDTSSILGMNYDESRCFWYMVCGGVFDRYPELRLYITHAGGFTPYHLGRFEQTNQTMAPDAVNEKPVSAYLENVYLDPDVHEPIMRKALVELIGVDRFIYGDNLGGSDNFHGDLTDGIGLSESDREKIRSGNAIKLMPSLAPAAVSA